MSATEEKPQWKLVFNREGSDIMTSRGMRPSHLLPRDIEYFISKGMGFEKSKAGTWLECTSAQQNKDKKRLKACLLFNEDALREIEHQAARQRKPISDYIAESVVYGIGNLRYWGSGCEVRAKPIQNVEP